MPSVLDAVEGATPSDPTDVEGFTSAQDCWVCVDSALRVASGELEASDAAWYLLEPIFQSVSYELFGVDDVGSAAQETAEARALESPRIRSAINGLSRAIQLMAEHPEPTADVVDRCRDHVAAIAPEQ